MSLADKLPRKLSTTKSEVLWRGPEVDGITYSLLSRFLVCRERFRLLVVEGLRPIDSFNHRMQYGQMRHTAEETSAGGLDWREHLRVYCTVLCKQYPMQQEAINHWYNVCKVQFALYLDYWSRHPEQMEYQPLLQEQVFNVPYQLPSGRTVKLRGKWDSVDLVGQGKSAGIWLQENKTKGDIHEGQIKRQLSFDLQTMIYITALKEWQIQPGQYRLGGEGIPRGGNIQGVRYNVVRRPLSGGAGTIRQHKPSAKNPYGESSDEFYARLSNVIKDDMDSYFMRWQVYVTPQDIVKFRQQCLDPILEQLCDWWTYMLAHDKVIDVYSDVWSHNKEGTHWRHPYGVYSVLNEGGSSDYDEYLASGSTVGLQKVDSLFTELE